MDAPLTATYAAYDRLPGVRSTDLKTLDQGSPLHVRYRQDHPDDGDTASRIWLRAVHCAVLEPERFSAAYAVYGGTRSVRHRAYQAWLDSHPGCQALKQHEYDSALRIAEVIRQHPVAGPLLADEGGISESVLTWTERGQVCKAQIDRHHPDDATMADLKTVGSADLRLLQIQADKLGWDLQMAHYCAGLSSFYGHSFDAHLVCVEDKPPHGIRVLRATEDLRARAEARRDELLDRLAECERAEEWPDRHEGIVDWDPPLWRWPDDDDISVTVEEL